MRYIHYIALIIMSLAVNLQASNWLYLDKLDTEERAQKIRDIHVSQTVVDAQYQIAKDFTDVMHDNNVPYVILFGTQLGALRQDELNEENLHEGILRQGGLIPWDDDFDTGISIDQEENLKKLAPLFQKMGYDLIIDGEEIVGYKLVSQKPLKIQSDEKEINYHIFVDIFLYVKNEMENKYELFFEKGRKLFSKHDIKVEDFPKRCLYGFGPLKVWGLENAEQRLSHFYGKEWNKLGVYCQAHYTQVNKKYCWTLSKEDKKPALPSKLEENYLKIKKQLYWDEIYKKTVGISGPSTFSQFVAEKGYIKMGESLLDVGCGSGRDTIFFLWQGFKAIGVDESSEVVKRNNKLVTDEFKDEEIFKTADVRDFETLLPYQGYQHVYARFFLHAITESEEAIFMKFLKTLNVNSMVYLEFRTDKDPLYLKAKEGQTDHYRRFINLPTFRDVVTDAGFKILYECEEANLSVYKDDNPVLARLIFKKI